MNDRSPQNAYSISSFKSLPKDSSDFFTEGIKDLINEHRIALEIISEDKELLQKFRTKKTALGAASTQHPVKHVEIS